MFKKIITYLLLFSFLNYIGCSSSVFVTIDEYNQKMLEENPPYEIFLTTYDSKKYHFTNEGYYYIKNDTLFASRKVQEYEIERGKKVETGRVRTIQGKLSPGDIKSIKEVGPNEITVISNTGPELHLENKRFFYTDNDKLYGQGEI